jgi:hypothetical protein
MVQSLARFRCNNEILGVADALKYVSLFLKAIPELFMQFSRYLIPTQAIESSGDRSPN